MRSKTLNTICRTRQRELATEPSPPGVLTEAVRVTLDMNEDQVLAALHARGHEVGVEQGSSEVGGYSPEDAPWVLELRERR